MKKIMLVLILLAFPLFAQATPLTCEYRFSGAPAGNVVLEMDEVGRPADMATVSLFQAPARQMPVTIETPQTGELLRITLSKGDPNNEVVLVLYPVNGNVQKSKLINYAMPPIARELQGNCR